MANQVTVTPLAHRATWARVKTQYDVIAAQEPKPATVAELALSPKIKALCDEIDRLADGLRDALDRARATDVTELHYNDRAALIQTCVRASLRFRNG